MDNKFIELGEKDCGALAEPFMMGQKLCVKWKFASDGNQLLQMIVVALGVEVFSNM